MSKILLATHGGASSEGAVRVGKALSVRTGWDVDVIAALPPPAPTDYGFGPVFVPDASTEEVLGDAMIADVRQQLTRCGFGTLEPELVIGTPAATIAEEARERGAALIVVGLGPHHFAERALGGETALQLVQMASTPVLAVPASATTLPRRIMAAVDYSLTSLSAARIAASLLRDGDTIELVHVAQPVDVRAEQTTTGDAAERLAEIATTVARPSGVTVLVRVLARDPARALLEYLQGSHVELVALGSHGYGIWKRLLMGSVASKVLRLAQCSVLVVPARCAITRLPEVKQQIRTADAIPHR